MDNSTSLVPGRNPTGGPVYGSEGFVPGLGTTSGQNPLLPTLNLPSGAPVSNPFSGSVVPPAAPTFGANAGGGYSTTSLFTPSGTGSNPVSGVGDTTTRQQGRTLGELQSMYGEGLGALMYQFLQGGAGFNQDAINNLFAALQPGVERGTESLMNQFSASGNRFGSGAQIGLADYLSQVNLNEGQIESQMYEQAIQNYMSVLQGVSSQSLQQKETSGSILDTIASLLPGGGALASLFGGMKTSGSSSVPVPSTSSTPSALSYMPGDIQGEPTGNLPVSLSGNNISLLDVISSLSGGSPISLLG